MHTRQVLAILITLIHVLPPTVAVEFLWLRAGPGIEHTRIAILHQGDPLLLEVGPPATGNETWGHVWTRQGEGWVNLSYTTHTKGVNP